MNNYKSATTAGLLGIFLGTVGAHDWYLGDRKKGTIHVCLFGAGLALIIIGDAILPNVLSIWTVYKMMWLFNLLNWAAWALIAASEIWGFIDGVKILSQGDAGLAQRGFAVNPNAGMNPNMNMNMNQMNNMNGMNGMNNMGNMNNMNNGNMNNFGNQNNQNNQNGQNNFNNQNGQNSQNNQNNLNNN